MPFYQVVCITAHYPEYRHIKGLIQQSATLIMNQGGVVRNINSWGTFILPQRMRRHAQNQQIGDYWSMHFDASPRTLNGLNQFMRRDPRVVRWTMLKLGEKVEDVVKPREKTISRQ